MRLYDHECRACGQMSVLHGVCRECGQLHPEPVHPLHPNDGELDATPRSSDETPTTLDERGGDATDDLTAIVTPQPGG